MFTRFIVPLAIVGLVASVANAERGYTYKKEVKQSSVLKVTSRAPQVAQTRGPAKQKLRPLQRPTQAPTTQATTTKPSPWTQAGPGGRPTRPTTQQAPTTQAPTTQQAPATQAPTTQAPTTQAPAQLPPPTKPKPPAGIVVVAKDLPDTEPGVTYWLSCGINKSGSVTVAKWWWSGSSTSTSSGSTSIVATGFIGLQQGLDDFCTLCLQSRPVAKCQDVKCNAVKYVNRKKTSPSYRIEFNDDIETACPQQDPKLMRFAPDATVTLVPNKTKAPVPARTFPKTDPAAPFGPGTVRSYSHSTRSHSYGQSHSFGPRFGGRPGQQRKPRRGGGPAAPQPSQRFQQQFNGGSQPFHQGNFGRPDNEQDGFHGGMYKRPSFSQ